MEQKTVSETTTSTTPATSAPAYNKKKTIFYAYQVIWYILGIIEALLVFRVILKMLAANPGSGFANFIYQTSFPFAAPFLSLFQVATAQGSVLEWSTLFAMVVYLVIGVGIVKLINLVKPVTPAEVHETVDNT